MSERAKVAPLKALGILGGVVVALAGFIGLTALLGVGEIWAGFLFLACWALIDGMKPEALPKSAIGALLGLGIASLLFLLPTALGAVAGLSVALGVIAILVYLHILGRWPIAINGATMLVLTVATIPPVQAGADFRHALASLLAGIVYFGALVLGAAAISNRRASGATSSIAGGAAR